MPPAVPYRDAIAPMDGRSRTTRQETAMKIRATTAVRVGVFGAFIGALLLAALLGTTRLTSAEPLTTSSSGWTKQNFNDSCKKTGGKAYEIDQGDINYSYCTFPDGGKNRCDWIKKTCTFGEIVARPRGTVGTPLGDRATADGATGGTGGTTTSAGAGNQILSATDDRR
jgi:hypothetical protein